MAGSREETDINRVMHVDFRSRRVGCAQRPAIGERAALRGLPTRRNHPRNTPDPASLAALALLIVTQARADGIDGDLDVICRLLRERCDWSEEGLLRLRQTVATALEQSRRCL